MVAQNGKNALILPGQTKPASKLLVSTIREVQEHVGKPIAVRDIKGLPVASKRNARGTYEWTDTEVQIFLNPNTSHDIQEAVAAHELAHVIQTNDGYWMATTQPRFPELVELCVEINCVVLDVMADRWAEHQGFKVEEGLRTDLLPQCLHRIDILRQSGWVEAVDWNKYHTCLNGAVKILGSGGHGPVRLTREVYTQTYAVHYAVLKLRLGRFGLFTEVGLKFGRYYPNTERLGIEIANLAEGIGIDDKEHCFKAIVEIVKFLNIPKELMAVINR